MLTFPPPHTCFSLLKLAKDSHSPKLDCSSLEHAQVHAPVFPIYTNGSKSSEGVGCAAVFPYSDVFIFLPLVASIFTLKMYYFSRPYLYFVPRECYFCLYSVY